MLSLRRVLPWWSYRAQALRRVLRFEARSRARVDVHSAEIALHVRQGEQPGIHHAEPPAREVGHGEYAEVARGQLRQVGKVAQALVAPRGVGVVVGVALQVEQRQVGHQVVEVFHECRGCGGSYSPLACFARSRP